MPPVLKGKALDVPSELASRYIDVAAMPWTPTRFPGIDMKVLYEDAERGLLTALMRWQPGAFLPLHEHVDVEQTFVISGSLEDAEGRATTGHFVWRPAGSRHVARAPDGALLLAIFQQPNTFFDLGASPEPAQRSPRKR
jgi:anti-sigma factor ChrR (cupin superfamily)